MINHVRWVVVGFSLLASSVALAGHEQGNGGNAVVCRDASGKIISAELLDFYEARTLRQIQLDLGPSGLDYMHRVLAKLRPLERVAPVRAALYENWAANFISESLILNGVKFEVIPDSDHFFVPDGCEVEQLAVNREPELPTDHRYLINGDLWSHLDDASKAGLVLHEMIYREMASLGETNSRSSRYLNGIIHTQELSTIDQKVFVLLLHDIGIPTGEWNGWNLDLKAQRPNFDYRRKAATLVGIQELRLDNTIGLLQVHGSIAFYPSGKVAQATLAPNGPNIGNAFCFARSDLSHHYCAAAGTEIQVNENGHPFMIWYASSDRQTFTGPGYSLTPANPDEADAAPIFMEFRDDGNVYSCLRCRGYVSLGADRVEVAPDARSFVSDNLGILQQNFSSIAFGPTSSVVWCLVLAEPHAFRAGNRSIVLRKGSSDFFYDDGSILTGTLAAETSFQIQGQPVFFKNEVSFKKEGQLTDGTLANPATLRTYDGKTATFPAETQVSFDDNGWVVNSVLPPG